MARRKNQAAVALSSLRMKRMTPKERSEVARSGGLVGGVARAKKLTKAERKAIAQKAARARWEKKERGTKADKP
jgi:hypothetical protein